MSRPASAEHGAVFDFASLTRELREEESYAREGHTARTLLRAPDLRVILVVVRAGGTISEHHAQVTATVQVLAGKIRLQLPDRKLPFVCRKKPLVVVRPRYKTGRQFTGRQWQR